MFIELHIIQNFAPSNLNRDDTNNPKDTEFGGVRRARISSQCIKRAIRLAPVFADTTGVDIGIRTKWLARLLAQEFVDKGIASDEAESVALDFAKAYAGGMGDNGRTNVLLYLSPEELRSFSDTLLQNWEAILADTSEKKTVFDPIIREIRRTTKDRTSAPDIALFGRMLADKPDLSLDAACQVAHAISTHRITMDMDFYTAVDDLQEGGETGAGMMGYTSFNSATFYRYARLDWRQLVANLSGDTELAARTVEGFLRASVVAIPTGKQNTFAAQNPPSFLLAVVRQDGMSWSLANAFERPVSAWRDTGLVEPSIKALDQYWGNLVRMYGNGHSVIAALSLVDGLSLDHLGSYISSSLDQWVSQVSTAVRQSEQVS